MSRSTLYFPLLDQARFFAFLAVFLVHCFGPAQTDEVWLSSAIRSFSSNGHLGVDFFFCLSAFLITYILLGEKESKKFSLSNFYVRRILRIWPLYFLVLLLSFGGISILNYSLGNAYILPDLIPFLLFYANYYMMMEGIDFFFPLTFLWTIAIEEQFYLIWGFLIKFGHRQLVLISVLLIIVHLGFKLTGSEGNYFNTMSYLPYFALGSLSAIAFRTELLHSHSKTIFWLGTIGTVTGLLLLPFLNQSSSFLFLEQLIWACLFSMLLFGLCMRKESDSIVSKALRHLGQISYGLYCLHAFALLAVFQLWTYLQLGETTLAVFVIRPLMALALSALLAEMSYRIIEQPFLNLKRKLN